jgi:hypothetical protein
MKEAAKLRSPYFPSSLTIAVRCSSWWARVVQLREMPKSTADRRAETCRSFPRILYSAAYVLHCWIVSILHSGCEARVYAGSITEYVHECTQREQKSLFDTDR